MQSVSEQRQLASLESDQQQMETLAARREELQQALEEQASHEQGWMATASASFFLVNREPVSALLQNELEQVEKELRIVCDRIVQSTQHAQQQQYM